MENMDILKDKRFRRAVIAGELYRCVAIYLRIQYPDVEDLSTLPHDARHHGRGYRVMAEAGRVRVKRE